jgi:uncharacterized protein YeaO (DUF488 family)
MIETKRAYRPPTEDDGFRVLVERLWPRGLSKQEVALDLWLKEVTPSPELRKWFNHDPKKWEKFCRRYWNELADKEEEIRLLQEKAEEGTLTLVYGSYDEAHNAAVALKLYLEEKPAIGNFRRNLIVPVPEPLGPQPGLQD